MQINNVGVEECFSIPWDELQVRLTMLDYAPPTWDLFYSFLFCDWGFLLTRVFVYLKWQRSSDKIRWHFTNLSVIVFASKQITQPNHFF